MDDASPTNQFVKSPLIFLLLVGILVVSTLVVGAEYFLRPQIESDLKNKIIYGIAQTNIKKSSVVLSGRDVILNGAVKSKADALKAEKATKEIFGVRQINNQTIIKSD